MGCTSSSMEPRSPTATLDAITRPSTPMERKRQKDRTEQIKVDRRIRKEARDRIRASRRASAGTRVASSDSAQQNAVSMDEIEEYTAITKQNSDAVLVESHHTLPSSTVVTEATSTTATHSEHAQSGAEQPHADQAAMDAPAALTPASTVAEPAPISEYDAALAEALREHSGRRGSQDADETAAEVLQAPVTVTRVEAVSDDELDYDLDSPSAAGLTAEEQLYATTEVETADEERKRVRKQRKMEERKLQKKAAKEQAQLQAEEDKRLATQRAKVRRVQWQPEQQPIVIDLGAYVCRAGYATHSKPSSRLHSVIGRPKSQAQNSQRLAAMVSDASASSGTICGNDVYNKRSLLNVSQPYANGMIRNWDDVQSLWDNVFEQLQSRHTMSDHPLMLTTSALARHNPQCTLQEQQRQRDQLTQFAFEQYQVPQLYLGSPALYACFYTGKATALVIDLGHQATTLSVIYEQQCLSDYTHHLPVGGQHVTEYLATLLSHHNVQASTLPLHIVQQLKEQHATVLPYETDPNTYAVKELTYTLPDATSLQLRSEHFACNELLFNPALVGIKSNGIVQAAAEVLQSVPAEMRDLLAANIVIIGGVSTTSGMTERLTVELREALSVGNSFVGICAMNDRSDVAWAGAAALCSTVGFQSNWITQQEYDEHGLQIVARKCH